MSDFKKGNITIEEGFWTMYYFLLEHYELSEGNIDVSDILSFSQPIRRSDPNLVIPADSSMIEYWHEALEKLKESGLPGFKFE